MIDVAGIPFLAEKHQLNLVVGLRIEVEERYGRKVLIASHSMWDGDGAC
ncbi:hypothetical protein [Anaeromyxobacter oryzae]|uniref:Uncharacterized protein n=1 Tax=Anaeromyxobacter oryzae TaxID=2918170 RepID=A0ABM7WTT7_9BACT|nr:hypothetical protein [Anaeromyxobacter oryzae]BDG02910.1 hypothetical protein AMOR_19060 [Anaeromyxobacter oryzae]